jgi:hypothetical protein
MKHLSYFIFFSLVLSCNSAKEKVLNNSFEKCISATTKETFILLQKSFEKFIIEEGLKNEQNQPDYKAFVFNLATLCDSEPPIFSEHKPDTYLLNLIRKTNFDQLKRWDSDNSEKFFGCFKELNIPKNSTLNSYLEVKNQVGNISPRLIARGLLYHTKEEEYSDALVRKIILIELYLPYITEYKESERIN